MDSRPEGSLAQYLLGVILIARRDLTGGEQALRNFVVSSGNTQGVSSANEILQRLQPPSLPRSLPCDEARWKRACSARPQTWPRSDNVEAAKPQLSRLDSRFNSARRRQNEPENECRHRSERGIV